MPRVLVLNATYEPIAVVSERRAVVLTLEGKVDVVANTNATVGSEHLRFPVPSVVRLRYFVKVPRYRHAPLNRRAVFSRDKGRCQYCGKSAESIDHIRPRSRGGQHEWTNVVAACRRCNSIKADHLLEECSLRLTQQPVAPAGHSWLTATAGTVPDSWVAYLEPRAA